MDIRMSGGTTWIESFDPAEDITIRAHDGAPHAELVIRDKYGDNTVKLRFPREKLERMANAILAALNTTER